MKALTTKQKEVLAKLSKYHTNREGWTIAHIAVKSDWFKNMKREGLDLKTLGALCKKGYVELDLSIKRNSGLWNPKAESWGYGETVYYTSARVIKTEEA